MAGTGKKRSKEMKSELMRKMILEAMHARRAKKKRKITQIIKLTRPNL